MSNQDTFTSLVTRTVELGQAALLAAKGDAAAEKLAQVAIRQARTVRVRTTYVTTDGVSIPASAGVDVTAIVEALKAGAIAPKVTTPAAPKAPKAKAPKAKAPKAKAPKAKATPATQAA